MKVPLSAIASRMIWSVRLSDRVSFTRTWISARTAIFGNNAAPTIDGTPNRMTLSERREMIELARKGAEASQVHALRVEAALARIEKDKLAKQRMDEARAKERGSEWPGRKSGPSQSFHKRPSSGQQGRGGGFGDGLDELEVISA